MCRRDKALLALPILFALISYANTFQHGFVYDDLITVEDSPFIRDLRNLPLLLTPRYFLETQELSYRPVLTFTYFTDHALWRDRPAGYHATNVLLHAGNAFLAGVLASSAGLTAPISCLAGCLFAVHPVATEAVNCVSFREDLLALLFGQLSLLCFCKGRRGRAWSLVFFGASLLSKESGAVLPLVLILVEVSRRGKDLIKRTAPHFGLLGLYGLFRLLLLRWTGSGAQEAWSLADRLMATPEILLLYVRLMLVPVNLSAEYVVHKISNPFSLHVLGSVGILAGMGLSCAWGWRKTPRLFLGPIGFFLSLVPVCNILPLANMAAERYLYMPLVFVVFFFASLVSWLGKRVPAQAARLFLPGFLFGIVCLMPLTWARNKIWKDELTLCETTVRQCPESDRFLYNLANAFWDAGNLDESEKRFLELLDRTPDHLDARISLAALYEEQGRFNEAIQRLEEASQKDPQNPAPFINLASVLDKIGQLDQGLAACNKALSLSQNHPEALYNRGRILLSLHRPREALLDFQKAFSLKPSPDRARYVGMAFSELGESDKALAWIRMGLDRDPEDASLWADLGKVLRKQGTLQDATQALQRAIQLDPYFLDPRLELARTLVSSGDVQGAVAFCQETVRLAQDDPAVLDACGWMLVHENIAPQEGLSFLEKASMLKPSDEVIRSHLAEAIRMRNAECGMRNPD